MELSIFDQDELLALSLDDMKNQKYAQALEKVKFMLSRDSGPLEVHALAGKIYATLGLFDRAKHAFSNYISEVPDAYVELFQLGMVEKDMGNYDQAIETWTNVLAIHSNYPEALYYLGELNIQLDRISEARTWLLSLIDTAPDGNQFIPLADQLLNRIKGH